MLKQGNVSLKQTRLLRVLLKKLTTEQHMKFRTFALSRKLRCIKKYKVSIKKQCIDFQKTDGYIPWI
jgi:hypothetical protein